MWCAARAARGRICRPASKRCSTRRWPPSRAGAFPDAATFGAAIRQLLSQMNTPVGPADLQVLLGLVKPPKRPRGELDPNPRVIRLGPDAHRTRTSSPALPPLSGRIAEPSPLDRLRSAQARTSPGVPPRRSPAMPARTKTNDELDAYPPTPPPVARRRSATARVADATTRNGVRSSSRPRERRRAQHLGGWVLTVQRGGRADPRIAAPRRSVRRWSDLPPRRRLLHSRRPACPSRSRHRRIASRSPPR